MTAPSQDYAAAITWTSDWSAHLAANGGLTISSQTVTCPSPPTGCTPTISGNVVVDGTKVTFRLAQTGLTTPETVVCVVGVTLSNGDTDERDFPVQFTNT